MYSYVLVSVHAFLLVLVWEVIQRTFTHEGHYTRLCCPETCVDTCFMPRLASCKQVHFYLCSTTLNIHQKGLKMSIVVPIDILYMQYKGWCGSPFHIMAVFSLSPLHLPFRTSVKAYFSRNDQTIRQKNLTFSGSHSQGF